MKSVNPKSSPVITQPVVAPAPKKGDKLVRGGATAGQPGQIVTAANRWRENYNPLRDLNMRDAVSRLEMGKRGDYALLQWTYAFIEETFPTLSGLLTRCEAPLVNFDWDIKIKTTLPPGATPAMAERQRQTLYDAYEAIDNLKEAWKHLHLAEFRGFSLLQKHRTNDGEVYHLECLNHWCICRDGLQGNYFWNPDSRFTSSPFQSLGPEFCIGGEALPIGDFIIHECARPIDRIGLVNFIRQNLCEKDADAFIEIYGVPSGVVTMPENVPAGRESEYEAAARAVAEGAAGAIPHGASYQPNESPRGVDPFTPRLKHLDETLILAGTGGKLTMMAESGSGTLGGKVHDKTFAEIAGMRARAINLTFQRQFDAEALDREHPDEPHCVYFAILSEDEEDVDGLVKNVAALGPIGLEPDIDWLNEKTGYQLKAAPVPEPPAPGTDPEGREMGDKCQVTGDGNPVTSPATRRSPQSQLRAANLAETKTPA